MPSVESMAIVRTVVSPSCCATSRTSRRPSISVVSAFRIGGRVFSSWNCPSTTPPSTWVTRPTATFSLPTASFILSLPTTPAIDLQCLGAGDDFHQLLGDLRLPLPVVAERELVDHLARVAGGAVH